MTQNDICSVWSRGYQTCFNGSHECHVGGVIRELRAEIGAINADYVGSALEAKYESSKSV